MKLIIVVILVSLISGCASFSCGQFPRTGCTPVAHVYDSTHNGVHDYRADPKTERRTGRRGNARNVTHAPLVVSAPQQRLNYVMPGDPILTKPVVVRMLVTPWEDDAGDLVAGGYIYLRVKEAGWVLTK